MTDVAEPRRKRGGNLRLRLLLIGGFLLLVGAWTWKRYWLVHDIGSGPAGPAVAAELFAKPWRAGPTVLLGLGDSVTDGYGSTKGHSFFELLAAQPADDLPDLRGRDLRAVFPQLRAVNRAISGSTSFDIIDRVLGKFTPYPPDTLGVVVLSTGGNDLIHNYGRTRPSEQAMYGATLNEAQPWIAGYANRLDGTVTRLGQLFPGGVEIFVMTIFDPTDGVGDIEAAGLPAWPDGLTILHAYNEEIAACARRHAQVHVVPVHDAFLGHGLHCAQPWRSTYHRDDPGYWLYENLEDPNDRGYDAIRRLFLLSMGGVFSARAAAAPTR